MNKYKERQFKCLSCGKEVSIRRPKNKAQYCSLECYRTGKRNSRKTGKIIECDFCSNEVYKPISQLKGKNHFCSKDCANKYQARDKIKFICKICGDKFYWSKSRAKDNNPTYCSWDCRVKDKEHIFNSAIKGNVAQQNKKGLNKLELSGRKILKDIGVDFKEQVLMFNKFLVDVLIPSKNIIIQWDGVYWHTKPKRVLLDKSQDSYLKKCGYNVIRITDIEIKNNLQNVYDNIKRAIQ
jgi:very-short-patch-repair endonuclease